MRLTKEIVADYLSVDQLIDELTNCSCPNLVISFPSLQTVTQWEYCND